MTTDFCFCKNINCKKRYNCKRYLENYPDLRNESVWLLNCVDESRFIPIKGKEYEDDI